MANHQYISTVLRGCNLTAYLRAHLLGRRWSVLLQCPGGCPALRLVAGAKVNANKLWAITLGRTDGRGYLQTEMRDDVPGLEHFWLLDTQGSVVACSLGAPLLPKDALQQFSLKKSTSYKPQAPKQPESRPSSEILAVNDSYISVSTDSRQHQTEPSSVPSSKSRIAENELNHSSNSNFCISASYNPRSEMSRQHFSDVIPRPLQTSAINCKSNEENARSLPTSAANCKNNEANARPLSASNASGKNHEVDARSLHTSEDNCKNSEDMFTNPLVSRARSISSHIDSFINPHPNNSAKSMSRTIHQKASFFVAKEPYSLPKPKIPVSDLLKSPFFQYPLVSNTVSPAFLSMDLMEKPLIKNTNDSTPPHGIRPSAFHSPMRKTSDVRFVKDSFPIRTSVIEQEGSLMEKEMQKCSVQPGAQPRYAAHCLLGKDAYCSFAKNFFSKNEADIRSAPSSTQWLNGMLLSENE